MAEQTAAFMFKQSIMRDQIVISDSDREILCQLAEKVAELAARDIEQQKKQLWYKVNALEKTKPIVFCDPENGWNEIITDEQMKCEGELARQWEMTLRKEIFWGESMGDDKVIEAVFNVPYIFSESDWGMHEKIHRTKQEGSYAWEPPLKDITDLSKLHAPIIKVNYDDTELMMETARKTFEGILEVKLKGTWWWTLGMTWTLINLRGLSQIMYDMYDHPDELKQVMGILRDGHLAKLDYLQENGLLSLNTGNTYVGSGGFGFTKELPQKDFDDKRVRTVDMWGFCESQETVGVSAEMFEEFIYPYQVPIMQRFGINCYGCCEPLDKRWHVVKRYPNLRRVSVSPWADLEKMAEYLEDKYIYSYKPTPVDLAVANMDEDRVADNIRNVLQIAKDCRLEIIMKDNHTLGNNPQNAVRWCQIAQREAQKTL